MFGVHNLAIYIQRILHKGVLKSRSRLSLWLPYNVSVGNMENREKKEIKRNHVGLVGGVMGNVVWW